MAILIWIKNVRGCNIAIFINRFCKFRFFGDPHIHESFSRDKHGPELSFNTKHLVLPGLIDEDKLCENLTRKDFKVEVRIIDDKLQVHDRDPRLPDDLSELAKSN
jgi:hypothetical protein